MGLFARRAQHAQSRAQSRAQHQPGRELTNDERAALPLGFEAAGEALAARSPYVVETCWVVGHDLAGQGVSLGESLEALRATTRLIAGREPTFDESHSLAVAWSEATLGFLHRLSCADPLTGLATHAHVRERISELYRDSRARRHALVITDAHLPSPRQDGVDTLAVARRMTLLGETARTVFSSAAAIGQIGHNRLIVVVPRDQSLGSRVSLLKRMVEDTADRIWIEGLPETDIGAGYLLDELARS